MVAEAAYYRAAHRGFREGDSVQDWLAAEREINQMLGLPDTQRQREELLAFRAMRTEVMRALGNARENIDAETLRSAIDRASAVLREAGGFTLGTITRVTEALRHDMIRVAARIGPDWEALSEKTADLFSVWLGRSREFLADAASGVAEWLRQTDGKLGAHVYNAGEIAGSGTYECMVCSRRVVLETPSHMPRCTACGGTDYRAV